MLEAQRGAGTFLGLLSFRGPGAACRPPASQRPCSCLRPLLACLRPCPMPHRTAWCSAPAPCAVPTLRRAPQLFTTDSFKSVNF